VALYRKSMPGTGTTRTHENESANAVTSVTRSLAQLCRPSGCVQRCTKAAP
jgi:hypothetical protein